VLSTVEPQPAVSRKLLSPKSQTLAVTHPPLIRLAPLLSPPLGVRRGGDESSELLLGLRLSAWLGLALKAAFWGLVSGSY